MTGMIRKYARCLAPVAALAALLPAGPAAAQGEVTLESLDQLNQIIRWSGVFASIVLVTAAWLTLRLLARFVQIFSGEFSSRRMTLQKVYTVAQFFIYVATSIAIVLLSFRMDETTLAVIGGSIAVAVGFAMKDLVASYIAGLIVMLDRPFQVGDRVKFGGEYGDITSIGLRSVTMQTLDDNTVTIPNSKFLSDITASSNYGALDMQVVLTFVIAEGQDIDRAREIINEAALSSRYLLLSKPVVVLVNQWTTQTLVGVEFTLKAYVLDTEYEKPFGSDISLRVLRAFAEEGFRFPRVDTGARPAS